jgi:hypothetical protein
VLYPVPENNTKPLKQNIAGASFANFSVLQCANFIYSSNNDRSIPIQFQINNRIYLQNCVQLYDSLNFIDIQQQAKFEQIESSINTVQQR